MGIFSSIKDAIFGKKAVAAEPAAPAAPSPIGTALDAATSAMATAAAAPPAEVDVDAILTAEAAGKDLNWRTSIVDLMKLIGVDSDYDSRKALAQELGRTDYSGTAEDNVWLHRKVMGELSRNGGKVPAEFLD